MKRILYTLFKIAATFLVGNGIAWLIDQMPVVIHPQIRMFIITLSITFFYTFLSGWYRKK